MAAFFPALRALQLKSDALTDGGLACLTRLARLEQLELVDCEAVMGCGLPALLRALPRLMVCPQYFSHQKHGFTDPSGTGG